MWVLTLKPFQLVLYYCFHCNYAYYHHEMETFIYLFFLFEAEKENHLITILSNFNVKNIIIIPWAKTNLSTKEKTNINKIT